MIRFKRLLWMAPYVVLRTADLKDTLFRIGAKDTKQGILCHHFYLPNAYYCGALQYQYNVCGFFYIILGIL